MTKLLALLMTVLATLSACAQAQDNSPVGLTLLFLNKGKDSIGVRRFDPDGKKGPVPGAVGRGGGAQMTFMAGDSKRGVPEFVEVEWIQETPESKSAYSKVNQPKGKLQPGEWDAFLNELAQVDKLVLHYTRRINLTPLIPPELLAQVRANRSTTHLKLTVIFKDGNVTILAEPEVWKKPGRYSPSDTTPEALAAGKAAYQAWQERTKAIFAGFYGDGYYLGEVTGALSGSLTLNVHSDSTIDAVIAQPDGTATPLKGSFDTTSKLPVRKIELSGKGTLGKVILTGEIDLQAATLHGTWTIAPSTPNTPSPQGDFKAER